MLIDFSRISNVLILFQCFNICILFDTYCILFLICSLTWFVLKVILFGSFFLFIVDMCLITRYLCLFRIVFVFISFLVFFFFSSLLIFGETDILSLLLLLDELLFFTITLLFLLLLSMYFVVIVVQSVFGSSLFDSISLFLLCLFCSRNVAFVLVILSLILFLLLLSSLLFVPLTNINLIL